MNILQYYKPPLNVAPPVGPSFISTWDTRNLSSGSSLSNQITIRGTNGAFYDATIDWGDGTTDHITAWNQSELTHTYSIEGVYTISITGDFTLGLMGSGDRLKILDISQFGNMNFTTQGSPNSGQFRNCSNLEVSASDGPTFPIGFQCAGFFYQCSSLTGTLTDWSKWDVSGVTNFSTMFSTCPIFEGDVSSWDVSNGQIFQQMFASCFVFNVDIGGWNVSSGLNFSSMFLSAYVFNQNIGGWDMSNAVNLIGMFSSARAFNNGGSPSINNWDVSQVTVFGGQFTGMFRNAWAFNQPLGNWNVSSGSVFRGMFNAAYVFNQNIGAWDMSSATDTRDMFLDARLFNNGGSPTINNWDVSGVLNMNSMFREAEDFNQPISNWDVSLVADAGLMFYEAFSFSQDMPNLNWASCANMELMFRSSWIASIDISNWNVSNVINMRGMFRSTNFNGDITGWVTSSLQLMGGSTANGMFYDNSSFDQDLSDWDISNVTDASGFILGGGFSTTNYDSILTAWASQSVQSGVIIDFGTSKYTSGGASEAARNTLIGSPNNWTITDGGIAA